SPSEGRRQDDRLRQRRVRSAPRRARALPGGRPPGRRVARRRRQLRRVRPRGQGRRTPDPSPGGTGRDRGRAGVRRRGRGLRRGDAGGPAGGPETRRPRQGHRLHFRHGSGTESRGLLWRKDRHRGGSEGPRHHRLDRENPQDLRILIVRLSALGDIVHTLPLALNARMGGATVGWLTERRYRGLLEGNESIEYLFFADTKRWRRNPFSAENW